MPTILIVEDNEMNRDMLSRRLARRGFDVHLAEDGSQGLAMARDRRPSLILLDLSLPGLDGWEVARRLKADPDTRATPVIALTAHAMAEDRARALQAGCDDYDTKPIELDRLLVKINRLLADHSEVRRVVDFKQPEAEADALPPDTAETDVSDTADRGTILVVDDNPENRDMLSRRLERRGFTVASAADGPTALALATEHHFDLVLLDVMMPGMNGLEVLRGIREVRSLTDLPVIMVTARDQSQDVVEALGLGANDYITKPVDFAIALARIQTQLAARRADPLTGLPNRLLFLDRLRRLIDRHRERGSSFAVFFLDIDRFKIVNDSLGHLAGDQLILGIARRLEISLRSSDTIARLRPTSTLARLGGDEFAIALDRMREGEDAVKVAERISMAMSDPFTVDGRELYVTTSVGIVMSDSRYEKPEELLRDADTAMYAAKAQGRGRYQMFDVAMHDAAQERLRLESDLARAIEREEFVVQYQPIVSLPSGRTDGFEALVRWSHPDLGMLAPGRFMAIAEETGLVVPLGRWVLRQACQQLRAWDVGIGGIDHLSVSVNLTAREFADPFLVDDVAAVLEETGLAPRRLKLEILETALLDASTETVATLGRLRKLGIDLVLDDFGTGYSTLSYLQKFPLNTLKVDRTFVQRIGSHEDSGELVKAIVSVAATLSMDVTAEGIETQEQLAGVSALSCQRGQGFYFSKPLDGADIEAWLRRTQAGQADCVIAAERSE
jgi:diguanylate cyclase (GGDEF)-like protein